MRDVSSSYSVQPHRSAALCWLHCHHKAKPERPCSFSAFCSRVTERGSSPTHLGLRAWCPAVSSTVSCSCRMVHEYSYTANRARHPSKAIRGVPDPASLGRGPVRGGPLRQDERRLRRLEGLATPREPWRAPRRVGVCLGTLAFTVCHGVRKGV